MKYAVRGGLICLLVALLYLCALAFPQSVFSHRLSYRNFEVFSDRPIDPHIARVLDDVTRRLQMSELYRPSDRFRIFFCNSSWRLWLFSQRFSDRMGGEADTWLTRNAYIRASDIAHNRIHSPGPGDILDAGRRPLSYFIAHEATHVMESRTFGRFMNLRYPRWLVEGYADYVGKGGDFDFEGDRRLLRKDNPLLDYAKSGLYRRFHLEVSLLLDKKRLSVRQVFAAPPREADLIGLLKSGSRF